MIAGHVYQVEIRSREFGAVSLLVLADDLSTVAELVEQQHGDVMVWSVESVRSDGVLVSTEIINRLAALVAEPKEVRT